MMCRPVVPLSLRLAIALAALVGCQGSLSVGSNEADLKAGEVTLWPRSAVPAHPVDSDAAAVELGVKFKASRAGTLTGLRFYQGAANSGSRQGHLWSSSGTLLASVTFPGDSRIGWKAARFTAPVNISANTVYIASYYAPRGHYAADNGYFSTGRTSGPLYALRDGEAGGNGVYRYGASGFPQSSYQSSNYYVDVLFAPATSGGGGSDGGIDEGGSDGGSTPTADCTDRVCGPDGAGGSCGTCASGSSCDPAGQCISQTAQLCPAQQRVITAADVANFKNSGYPAGTKVFVPDAPDPWGGCFPGPKSTGIPAGTTLTPYTGPCTITTAGTVINAKNVTCTLFIRAANVVIKNSKVTSSNLEVDSGSLTMTDSEVDFGGDLDGQGLTGTHITALRLNLHGGHRQMWCDHCTMEDSYLHDQYSDPTGTTHSSAARVENNSTYRHNTFLCNAKDYPPDSGCSADQTGYADFGPIHDNTMDKNLYMATTSGSYCAYGGWNVGKPYNDDPLNSTNIHFTNNVFARGTSPNAAKTDRAGTPITLASRHKYTCGYYGVATSFKASKPGFIFTGNRWDDGLLLDDDPLTPYGWLE